MTTTVFRASIDPGDVSFSKKILAGTTFEFRYPNPNGFARSIFLERNKRVILRFRDSDVTLDGIVTGITNDPVATISCADPIGLLKDKKITPGYLNTLTGRDCARAIADIILKDSPDWVQEKIEGTEPLVTLPQDFITKQTGGTKVVRKIVDYIRTETNRLSVTPVDYFLGFIGDSLRFMKVPPISAETPTLTLTGAEDIFEDEPDFHFDRLINRARVTGATTTGEEYTDLQSAAMFGIREPDKPLSLTTDDPILLYKLARDTVEANKSLTFSRKMIVPDGYWLTPGIHTVDVLKSQFGARGLARVTQVEGNTGAGGKVTVTLGPLPLDDSEVLHKVLGL